MRLLLEEGRGIDANKFDLTFGGGQCEIKILTYLVDIQVFALVDYAHVDEVLIQNVQESY